MPETQRVMRSGRGLLRQLEVETGDGLWRGEHIDVDDSAAVDDEVPHHTRAAAYIPRVDVAPSRCREKRLDNLGSGWRAFVHFLR
jgi:hypothetical protein